MRKILIIILSISLIFTGCTKNNEADTELNNETTSTMIATQEPTPTATATATAEPTPSPTPIPTEPKYIFIVIGDGFGRGHMIMGEIYARIENEDMNSGAVWESFPQQKMVDGRGESASGGTALATGYVSPPSYISQNTDYQDLYTIMDRAKENGLSTGVVTNSFLLDATPATFLTHDDWRLNAKKLSERIGGCNVDYIAGGGLQNLVPQRYYSSFNSVDARYKKVVSEASDESEFSLLLEQGYTSYLGMTGAQDFLQQVDAGTYTDEKSICVFSETTMAYESYKMKTDKIERCEYVPSLVDMTKGGIQTLSQNPNGFVMMIEEASIDKRCHNGSQSGTIAQIRLLNDTLAAIMEFYNEHPYETLVIFTADHETGDYVFNEEKYAEFKTKANFTWSDNSEEVLTFLDEEWDVEVYGSKVTGYIKTALESPWETVHEDRAPLYNYITLQTSLELGVEFTSEYHSWQLIPLCSIGVKNEELDKATGIQDIPIIICDIMGWEALPAVIEK